MSQRRPGHAPVAFDELLWQEDLKRETGPGSDVARRHRAEIELHGQAMAALAPVEQIGAIAPALCQGLPSRQRWPLEHDLPGRA